MLLSFLCMIIMLLTAFTLLELLPAEMHSSERSHADVKAHYVARSGL